MTPQRGLVRPGFAGCDDRGLDSTRPPRAAFAPGAGVCCLPVIPDRAGPAACSPSILVRPLWRPPAAPRNRHPPAPPTGGESQDRRRKSGGPPLKTPSRYAEVGAIVPASISVLEEDVMDFTRRALIRRGAALATTGMLAGSGLLVRSRARAQRGSRCPGSRRLCSTPSAPSSIDMTLRLISPP
jgi:hypothetical protein